MLSKSLCWQCKLPVLLAEHSWWTVSKRVISSTRNNTKGLEVRQKKKKPWSWTLSWQSSQCGIGPFYNCWVLDWFDSSVGHRCSRFHAQTGSHTSVNSTSKIGDKANRETGTHRLTLRQRAKLHRGLLVGTTKTSPWLYFRCLCRCLFLCAWAYGKRTKRQEKLVSLDKSMCIHEQQECDLECPLPTAVCGYIGIFHKVVLKVLFYHCDRQRLQLWNKFRKENRWQAEWRNRSPHGATSERLLCLL